MNQFSVPPLVAEATSGNLNGIVTDRLKSEPDRVILSRPVGEGWHPVTARDFEEEVRATAKGFVAAGIKIGDRVGLMARTRYEWTVLDFAIWSAGAVPVPIYETSSTEQINWILRDSGAIALIVETPQNKEVAQPALTPNIHSVWTITEGAMNHLVEGGKNISDQEIEERRNSATPDSLATLIYTSGTTGNPKGVHLTHGNFLFECGNIVQGASDLFLKPGGSTLLFLPLAHVFGRMIEVGALTAGLHMSHCSDITRLPKDLSSFKPTFVLAVPRIFEKIYNGAEAKADAGGKGFIFRYAAKIAISFSKASDAKKISPLLKMQHNLFDKLIYSKIRHAMGGRVEAAISGGAPLGTRLGHFYRGIGINILEGYGLTETTAGSNLNLTWAQKVGTVGRPIPGTTIKIAEDGEVLIKGPIIMKGYWQNDDANREAFTSDGFFRTGDLGTIDEDGYLSIVGRKKELIVTAGGKNVAPTILEDRVKRHPLVSQCLVVGDNKPFIGALITIDQDALNNWIKLNKKDHATVAELVNDPDLNAVIQTAVDTANKAVSRAESIRKFTILPVDFTIAGGELTAKLSIKRHVVTSEFAKEIEAIYQ